MPVFKQFRQSGFYHAILTVSVYLNDFFFAAVKWDSQLFAGLVPKQNTL